MTQRRRIVRSYLLFVSILLGTVALLIAVGWVPTRNLGGEGAIWAMITGCAVSLAGSALGGIPAAMAAGRPAIDRSNLLLGSLAIRLLLVLALILAVVFASPLPRKPFLVWLVISYLVLLPVDSIAALRANRES